MPGVLKPHCSAWFSRKASCIGCSWSPFATPSIVSTSAPSHCTARIVQDLTASPLICTTQAPHWLVSQPTCVPVRPRCSRKSCTSKVRPSTVAVAGLPLTVRLTAFCIATLPCPARPWILLTRHAERPRAPEFRAPAAPGQARDMSRLGRGAGLRAGGAIRIYRGGEAVEELVGQFARGAVDEARTDLRQLAADLRLHAVAHH